MEIYEDRFVAVIYSAKEEPVIFGDLRKEATYFVAWIPFRKRVPWMGCVLEAVAKELPPRNIDFIVGWEEPTKWADQFKLLHYRYEKHDRDDDPLRMAAEEVARSPLFKTTINLTLAIRKALRRYLGIEPAEPVFKVGKSHETGRQSLIIRSSD